MVDHRKLRINHGRIKLQPKQPEVPIREPEKIIGGKTNIDILRDTLTKLNLDNKPKKNISSFDPCTCNLQLLFFFL